jgi:hypothetical protein
VWGKVVSGMEFVDKIKRGAQGSGAVAAPADKMIKVQVAADAKDQRLARQPSRVTVWKALAMTCQRPSTFSSVR